MPEKLSPFLNGLHYNLCLIVLQVESFLTVGSRVGYAVGVVTTTQITHASPAATYAHSADRGWQFKAEGDCQDIASQLVHNNHKCVKY